VVESARRVAGVEGGTVVVVPCARPASLWEEAREEGTALETAVMVHVGALLHVAAVRGAFGPAHAAQQATAAGVGGHHGLQLISVGVVEDLGGPHGTHMMHVNLLAPPVERAQHQRFQCPLIAVDPWTTVTGGILLLRLIRRLRTTALHGLLGASRGPPEPSDTAPEHRTLGEPGRSCVVRGPAARWALSLAVVQQPLAGSFPLRADDDPRSVQPSLTGPSPRPVRGARPTAPSRAAAWSC